MTCWVSLGFRAFDWNDMSGAVSPQVIFYGCSLNPTYGSTFRLMVSEEGWKGGRREEEDEKTGMVKGKQFTLTSGRWHVGFRSDFGDLGGMTCRERSARR